MWSQTAQAQERAKFNNHLSSNYCTTALIYWSFVNCNKIVFLTRVCNDIKQLGPQFGPPETMSPIYPYFHARILITHNLLTLTTDSKTAHARLFTFC